MAQHLVTVAEAAPWLTEAEASLPQGSLRRIAVFSLLTILLGFGGMTAWAALARVASARPSRWWKAAS